FARVTDTPFIEEKPETATGRLIPVAAARGICRPASGDRPRLLDPSRFAGRRRLPTGHRSRARPSYLWLLRTLFVSGVTFWLGGRAGRSALPRHGPRSSTRTAPARAPPQ